MPAVLTADQIHAVMAKAGFSTTEEISPGVTIAACMTAIALRESAGYPAAYNGPPEYKGVTATGDRSYGLTQINMGNADVYATIAPMLTDDNEVVNEQALFVPAINALAAYRLSRGGNRTDIDIAWYIDRAGTSYQSRYLAHLPEAQAAARFAANISA